MSRPSKREYYLNIAEVVAQRSTCLRRKYGAVIVKDDKIVSTGYNGASRGEINCCDSGECLREKLNIPKGERYELCKAVHAEMNAMLQAGRNDMQGAVLYITGLEVDGSYANPQPCALCSKMIKNTGITKVVGRCAGKERGIEEHAVNELNIGY